MQKKNSAIKKIIINGFVFASLFIAFYIGQIQSPDKNRYKSLEFTKEYEIDSIGIDGHRTRAYHNNVFIGTIAMGKAQGYGGPLEVYVLSDSVGQIIGIDIGENSETLAYLNKLKQKSYFNQFKGKAVGSEFLIDNDVEAVSGATLSSVGIAEACQEASWDIATNTFSLSTPVLKKQWNFGLKQVLVVLVFVLAFLSMFLRNKTIRNVAMAITLITTGFMFNSAVSITHFGRLFMGYIPDVQQHFEWWILLFGTITLIFVYGRNIYCHAVCPFKAVQVLLSKLSGINLTMPKQVNKYLLKTSKFLLWLCLGLIFISKNPTIASYEPFAMMFSLEGVGIQWYILPAALFGSLLFSNFFCRYFCPVGAGFNLLVTYRSKLIRNIKKRNEK